MKKYPDADANIFLTFSFSSYQLSDQPNILICDWPYDYFIRHFKEKSPDFFERRSIKRDNQQLAGSDLVIVLFKSILPSMVSNFEDRKIKYLDQYVINSLYKVGDNDELTMKKPTHNILFVGGNNYLYISGAKNLVEAFELIKKEYPLAKLHIVGLEKTDFDQLPDGVTCYGYLDKGTQSGKQLYYTLLQSTNIYVNTNTKWSGLSTTIEAMYFHIPVVVFPYDEFISIFGREINFGYYCFENTAEKIADAIRNIFNESQYIQMCRNAHLAVKDFTWSSYAGKLLDEIESVVNKRL
ncbi:MAG: glycosyltransferase family 4 protein [Enterococcus sp.]|nr:glycosyltransferase family 4 protein [Enterococcus sp.]